MWLETGLIGLMAIIGMVCIFYLSLWKKRSDMNSLPNPVWLPMIGASMTSLFSHAAVDFPFIFQRCSFYRGAYLGTVNNISRNISIPQPKFISSISSSIERTGIRLKVVKGMASFVLLLWLLQPAIAQFAADQGLEGLKKGDVKYALKKITLAQRLVPGNAYYYWCEGIILRDQAVELKNRELAALADSVFAKGTVINPYYSNNWIERIRLHRDHRALLDNPVSHETLLLWSEGLLAWHPYHGPVNMEYARTLVFLGQKRRRCYLQDRCSAGTLNPS